MDLEVYVGVFWNSGNAFFLWNYNGTGWKDDILKGDFDGKIISLDGVGKDI